LFVPTNQFATETARQTRRRLLLTCNIAETVPKQNNEYMRGGVMRLFFCAIPLVLAACTDSTAYLKNQRTGEIVKCGSAHRITLAEDEVQRSEAQCIQDYKDLGFIPVPGPD
jgi:hypothetical protein